MLKHSAIRANRSSRELETINWCFSIQDYESMELESAGLGSGARVPPAAPPRMSPGLCSTVLVSPRGFLTAFWRPAAHEYSSWRRTKDASQVNALRLTCSVFLDATRGVRCASGPACAMGPTMDAPTREHTARCGERACASTECERRAAIDASRSLASWCFGGAAVRCYSMAIDLARSRLLSTLDPESSGVRQRVRDRFNGR